MSLFGRKKGWKANGKEFRPLCSPLLAGSVNNIRLAVKGHKIDQGYHLKLYRTYIASALITPFRWYEHARYDFFLKQQKIEKDPLFILGHWRSGTTYLVKIHKWPMYLLIKVFFQNYLEVNGYFDQ